MKTIDITTLDTLIEGRPYIYIDTLPKEIKSDIMNFITGRTLMGDENGRVRIGKNLFNRWLKKIKYSGFDYDIPFLIRYDAGKI
jgi:hypothetical protein